MFRAKLKIKDTTLSKILITITAIYDSTLVYGLLNYFSLTLICLSVQLVGMTMIMSHWINHAAVSKIN